MHAPSHEPVTSSVHERPWLGLIYLFFVFLPLFYWPGHDRAVVALSVVATLVFLAIYFAFVRLEGRWRPLLVLASAMLGLVLIPINPGGNTFVIYAMVMAALALPERAAITVASALLLVTGLVFWWSMPRVEFALAGTGVVAIIGFVVVSGVLVARDRARRDAALRLTQDEVRRLATVAERERIGRDLHDLLGHTLTLVAIKSELAGKLLTRDPVAAKVQIAEVEQVARSALGQVREAVAGVRTSGLPAELAAARLALLSAGIEPEISPAPDLAGPTEAVLAMALREAVTNIIRHADCSRVEIAFGSEQSELRMQIRDDGRGGLCREGNGLTGMRERLREVSGTLEIDSPAGAGTTLTIRVPVDASVTGNGPRESTE